MFRLLYPFVLLLVLVPAAMSQSSTRTISGLVTSADDGTPLEGVQVTG